MGGPYESRMRPGGRSGPAVTRMTPDPGWFPAPVHVLVVEPPGYAARHHSPLASWEPAEPPIDGALPAAIEGDILCDSEGRLYERRDCSVRPLFDARPRRARRATAHAAAPVRAIADPAAGRRWVRFGDLRALISPLLAHPERLRDTHLLPLSLQVFEATTSMPAAEVTALLQRTAPAGAFVCRLTPDVAVQLSLEAVDGNVAGASAAPGDRFLRVDVLDDPTRLPAAAPSRPDEARAPDAHAAGMPARPPAPAAADAIPARFLGPWAFRLSREDAAWEAAHARGRALGRLRARWARWRHRRDWQRWRSLLEGRPVDEQLWAVRPPHGCWGDPDLDAWLRRTLAAGGYRSEMATEWEIYWRRKGC